MIGNESKGRRRADVTSLVFLHGAGGGHHAWERQIPYFAARGYASHAWDQPGYGASEPVAPYELAQVAAALARLVDALNDGPVVLVGHGMGGVVAQEMYARHAGKVKALALCFTSASCGGGSESGRDFVAARIRQLEAGRAMADIACELIPTLRGSISDPGGLSLAERIMAGVPPDTYRKALAMLTQFDRRALLAHIRVPTLVVAGGDDRIAPAPLMERMAQRIPNAEFVLLEGCGHLGPMDQPDAFNTALLAFLQRHAL